MGKIFMSMVEFSCCCDTYLNATLAYCSLCQQVEQARIVSNQQGVFLERICAQTGTQRSKLAADPAWYRQRLDYLPPLSQVNSPLPAKLGCPLDCGPCQWHSNRLRLPIFSITNDCNLDCPKCFTYNRPDKKYFKDVEDTKKIINHIINATAGVQLINLTGGEPLLHPQLFDILQACVHDKIGRITINTNGLLLAENSLLAQRLKESGVQLIFSLDTLDPDTSRLIHGRDITRQKQKALEVLETLQIPTTLLHVCIKGVNYLESQTLIEKYIKKDFVRGVTIQNMTFTGQNGSRFMPREHITLDEVETLLCRDGTFNKSDFFPHGGYHPLCYSIAYYVVCGERLFPLTRLLSWQVLQELLENTYVLDPTRDLSQEFMAGVNRLWAEGEDEEVLKALKVFIQGLYPTDYQISVQDRQLWTEKNIKMIYIHAHMDEDNFDIDRVSRCGDLVPDESGALIPACSYNLLFRQKDSRFWKAGSKPV
jgi:uncharacterized radical SAM superfamily Fe-S cluster-containing enzyme